VSCPLSPEVDALPKLTAIVKKKLGENAFSMMSEKSRNPLNSGCLVLKRAP
jgi:hypothetical protein